MINMFDNDKVFIAPDLDINMLLNTSSQKRKSKKN